MLTASAEPGELEHQLGGETGALVRLSDGTVVLYCPHPAQLARLYEDGTVAALRQQFAKLPKLVRSRRGGEATTMRGSDGASIATL